MKCALYLRVSSQGQMDKDTIEIQRQNLPKYAESQGWEIVDTYEDPGISGSTISERPAFQRLLNDATKGLFDIVCVWEHSRLTRSDNLEERGHILQVFIDNKIQIASPREGLVDPSTFVGEVLSMFTTLLSAKEKKDIARRTTSGKLKSAKNGKWVWPKLPFARIQDKETLEWSLDPFKAKILKKAVFKFISPDGPSIWDLAAWMTKQGVKVSHVTLNKVFHSRLGDTIETYFKDSDETVVFHVPRIVSNDVIKQVHEKIAFNSFSNRKDTRDYLLTGFLFCSICGARLSGQYQREKHEYYRHYHNKNTTLCDNFKSISATNFDRAIMETIYENIHDVPSFESAIRDEIPDKGLIESLTESIRIDQVELSKVEASLGRLVDALLNGTLDNDAVKSKNDALVEQKTNLLRSIEVNRERLANTPDPIQFQQDMERIRLSLLDEFGSREHFDGMTFQQKRSLLDSLFSGHDRYGEPYGIFVEKLPDGIWKYTLKAKLFEGFRLMKGKDFDYYMAPEPLDYSQDDISSTKPKFVESKEIDGEPIGPSGRTSKYKTNKGQRGCKKRGHGGK